MAAKILDGKIVRDKIAEDLKSKISLRARDPSPNQRFSETGGLSRRPKLVIIQVGDLPESNTYIRQKVLFGQKIGAIIDHQKLPSDVSQEKLIRELLTINREPSIHGIIIQQPLPQSLDKNKVINTIDPTKDVDGQTAANIKFLFEGKTQPGDTPGVLLAASELTPGVISNGYIPATTRGIFTLLDYYKILVEGKHIVVVGRSTLVGKPTALLALNKNATVTICHSKTQDLPAITKTADILIVAAGQPKLITKDHVGKNQVVIDVGINVIKSHSNLRGYDTPTSQVDKIQPESEPTDRKLVGDVDFDSVSKVVAAISPVPGGIGPMTVASLFQNLLQAYIHQNA